MTDIAVIGIGSWGQNLVRTFDDLATVRTACHNGSDANATWLAEEYPEVDRTTDYDSVLADDAVDAVAIATPIPTLADVAERALRAGKDVFVEKPMAATPAEADALAALAADRDQTLFVGYIFVHHPIFARVRETLSREGADHVRLDWHTEGSFGPDLLRNLACHPVSIAVAAFGRPDDVTVWDSFAATGGTDVVTFRLSYDSVEWEVLVDRLSPESQYSMTAVTDRNGIYVATDDELYAFDREGACFEPTIEEPVDPLGEECQNFLNAIESRGSPQTDGPFGVAVHEVLAEIRAGL